MGSQGREEQEEEYFDESHAVFPREVSQAGRVYLSPDSNQSEPGSDLAMTNPKLKAAIEIQ